MTDSAGIDVGVFDSVLLLEPAFGAEDTFVLRAGEAEPEAALDDGPPLGPGGALESGRAVLRVAAERAVGAV